MINTGQALYKFWSGFGLPAYTVNTVPWDAELPYITYSLVETEPLEPATHYAQVWYRGTGNTALLTKADEIKAAIGSGKRLECDGGAIVLRPSTPPIQLMTGDEPETRFAYINLQINCYHT